MRQIKLAVLFVSTCLLSHCAAPPSRPPSLPTLDAKVEKVDPWETHQRQIADLKNWQVSGRIAANDGKEGGSAAFDWRQQKSYYHIKFMGAFGAGTAILTGGPQNVVFLDNEGKRYEASSPERLMQKISGWHLPVNGLQYWVRGIPIPQLDTQLLEVDEAGQLVRLIQAGWEVSYGDYHTTSRFPMPKKVSLVNDNLKVKIVMKQWRI